MANFYTQFSAALKLDDAEMAQRALKFFEDTDKWAGDSLDGDEEPSFDLSIINDKDTGELSVLWMHADEDGSPSHVATFALALGKELKLSERWGFSWANTCGKPYQFGGGCVVIDFDGERAMWFNTTELLAQNGVQL